MKTSQKYNVWNFSKFQKCEQIFWTESFIDIVDANK